MRDDVYASRRSDRLLENLGWQSKTDSRKAREGRSVHSDFSLSAIATPKQQFFAISIATIKAWDLKVRTGGALMVVVTATILLTVEDRQALSI